MRITAKEIFLLSATLFELLPVPGRGQCIPTTQTFCPSSGVAIDFSGTLSNGVIDFAGPTYPTSGTGILMRHNTTLTQLVPSGSELSLINLQFKNTQTVAGASEFYGIRIITDSDAVDTAAGVNIGNFGQSDNIFLLVAGKSGETPSAPTGIGVDVNRCSTPGCTTENSSQHTGAGIQVWDWSQSATNSVTNLVLRKVNSVNSPLLMMRNDGDGAAQVFIKAGNTAEQERQFIFRGKSDQDLWILGVGADATNPFKIVDVANGRNIMVSTPGPSSLAEFPQGVKIGPSPTITSGTGVPSDACGTGSLFLRTDGGVGSTLYVCEAGAWQAK